MSQSLYRCPACGREFPADSFAFLCDCGGLLSVAPFTPAFPPRGARAQDRSVFRYAGALPPFSGRGADGRDLGAAWASAVERVSLGEGGTPLVRLDPDSPGVLLKADYLMPTLSFKDRGAAVLVAAALAAGARKVVQDSSGNAGAAVAAYAARAGLACDIYVPASTSPGKLAQIEASGARCVRVPGSREDTANAALEAAERGAAERSAFYASHVYNPLFYEGTKTYVFEIFEALGRLPDTLYVPLGNGTLVLGAWRALKDLKALGLIERYPRLVAVQAERCAPVLAAWRRLAETSDGSSGASDAAGGLTVEPVVNRGTEAEGIAIAAPKRGAEVIAALRELGGEVVAAPEEGLAPAKAELARRGLFVETTSAACLAAYRARHGGAGLDEGLVVLPLCGSGLKGLH